MSQTVTRTIHDEVTFQAAPLTTQEWVEALGENGSLTSVVAIDHDEFMRSIADSPDAVYDLLAVTQAAHTEAYGMDWRMVAVYGDQVLVEVTNDLRDFVLDPECVHIYNTTVAPEDRLTRERLLAVGVTPESIDRFYNLG